MKPTLYERLSVICKKIFGAHWIHSYYVNYRGERTYRTFSPIGRIKREHTSYHGKVPTITAFDFDKQEIRKFCLFDFVSQDQTKINNNDLRTLLAAIHATAESPGVALAGLMNKLYGQVEAYAVPYFIHGPVPGIEGDVLGDDGRIINVMFDEISLYYRSADREIVHHLTRSDRETVLHIPKIHNEWPEIRVRARAAGSGRISQTVYGYGGDGGPGQSSSTTASGSSDSQRHNGFQLIQDAESTTKTTTTGISTSTGGNTGCTSTTGPARTTSWNAHLGNNGEE